MIDHSNSSNASLSYSEIFSTKVAFTVVHWFLFVISIIGNSLILRIVFKDQRLKTTTNFLIANMAVSDIFSAVLGFYQVIIYNYYDGRWLIGGVFGNILCKISNYVVTSSFPVSMYSCVFIAIDRYYAVAYPMKKPLRKIKYIIAGIWITSGLINTGYLYWIRTVQYGELLVCWYIDSGIFSYYHHINLVFTAALPALAVTIIYTLIIYKLHQHKLPGQQTDSTIRRREQQNRKVLKMSVTIVGMLYLSFGFWLIIQFLFSSGKLHNMSPLAQFNLHHASFVMLYMSLVYNFFIYLIFNNIYRENIKAIIAKCGCTFCLNKTAIENRETAQQETVK